MSLWSDDSSTPTLEDSEAPESVPSPIATASRSKRARRRAEKALIRQAHDEAHTRELRAICAVIEGLPAAVPSLQNQLATFLDRKHHHKQTMDELQLQEQQRVPSKLAVDEDLVQDALTAISRTLETGTPYRSLREAYGHSEGTVVLRDMIDRPQSTRKSTWHKKHLSCSRSGHSPLIKIMIATMTWGLILLLLLEVARRASLTLVLEMVVWHSLLPYSLMGLLFS